MDMPTAHFFRHPSESSCMSFSARSDFYSHVKCDGIRSSVSMFLPFKGVSISSRWRNSEIKCVQNNAGRDINDDDDIGDESTLSASIEQGKRIVALQKELLYQIAERKKLVSTLKESLGRTTEQVKASNDVNKNVQSSSAQVSQSDADGKIVNENPVRSTQASSSRVLDIPSPMLETLTPGKEKRVSEIVGENHIKKQTLDNPALDDSANTRDEQDDASKNAENLVEPLAGTNVMNVVIVSAECAPWSKTGGLGDVAGALPKALARRGHRVMMVAPRYGQYAEATDTGVRKTYDVAGQEVGYFHGYIDGVDHVFIDNNVFHQVGNNIYGGNREDILKRMVLFCKAAIEVPWHVPCGGVCYGDGNLVFIANDWHTALLPVYLQAFYRDNGLMQFTRSILVIHNMAHQGRGPLSDFSFLGLPDHYVDKFRLFDPIGGEHLNIFMAGLITAHRVVAVSHGYAWECQTQEGGWGLDGVMRSYNWKLRGIVNGIDDKEWSPELDVHLKGDGYINYSIDTLAAGKSTCKAALQKELGLPVRSDVPIFGFIGRLDDQKGVDIIANAMHWIQEQDLQLVLLGTGRPDLENMLRKFESENRDKIRGWVGFSVRMAHRITAACDILLMPSRFEPCGLNQLYAMRYGTIPVVHAVGGLRDTVKSFDPYANTGTGWTFEKAEPGAMIHAIGNALWTYREFKDSWSAMQKRGMSQDLSWDNAAIQYEEVMLAAKYQW